MRRRQCLSHWRPMLHCLGANSVSHSMCDIQPPNFAFYICAIGVRATGIHRRDIGDSIDRRLQVLFSLAFGSVFVWLRSVTGSIVIRKVARVLRFQCSHRSAQLVNIRRCFAQFVPVAHKPNNGHFTGEYAYRWNTGATTSSINVAPTSRTEFIVDATNVCGTTNSAK